MALNPTDILAQNQQLSPEDRRIQNSLKNPKSFRLENNQEELDSFSSWLENENIPLGGFVSSLDKNQAQTVFRTMDNHHREDFFQYFLDNQVDNFNLSPDQKEVFATWCLDEDNRDDLGAALRRIEDEYNENLTRIEEAEHEVERLNNQIEQFRQAQVNQNPQQQLGTERTIDTYERRIRDQRGIIRTTQRENIGLRDRMGGSFNLLSDEQKRLFLQSNILRSPDDINFRTNATLFQTFKDWSAVSPTPLSEVIRPEAGGNVNLATAQNIYNLLPPDREREFLNYRFRDKLLLTHPEIVKSESLDDIDNHLEGLKAEKSSLNQEMIGLSRGLSNADQTQRDLISNQIRELMARIDPLNRQIADAQRMLGQVESKLQSRGDEKAKERINLNNPDARIGYLRSENERLTNENSRLLVQAAEADAPRPQAIEENLVKIRINGDENGGEVQALLWVQEWNQRIKTTEDLISGLEDTIRRGIDDLLSAGGTRAQDLLQSLEGNLNDLTSAKEELKRLLKSRNEKENPNPRPIEDTGIERSAPENLDQEVDLEDITPENYDSRAALNIVEASGQYRKGLRESLKMWADVNITQRIKMFWNNSVYDLWYNRRAENVYNRINQYREQINALQGNMTEDMRYGARRRNERQILRIENRIRRMQIRLGGLNTAKETYNNGKRIIARDVESGITDYTAPFRNRMEAHRNDAERLEGEISGFQESIYISENRLKQILENREDYSKDFINDERTRVNREIATARNELRSRVRNYNRLRRRLDRIEGRVNFWERYSDEFGRLSQITGPDTSVGEIEHIPVSGFRPRQESGVGRHMMETIFPPDHSNNEELMRLAGERAIDIRGFLSRWDNFNSANPDYQISGHDFQEFARRENINLLGNRPYAQWASTIRNFLVQRGNVQNLENVLINFYRRNINTNE